MTENEKSYVATLTAERDKLKETVGMLQKEVASGAKNYRYVMMEKDIKIESLQSELKEAQVGLTLCQNDLEDKRAVIDLFNDGGQVPDEGLWASLKQQRDDATAERDELRGQLIAADETDLWKDGLIRNMTAKRDELKKTVELWLERESDLSTTMHLECYNFTLAHDAVKNLLVERDELQVELAILRDCCAVYKKAMDGFNARLDKLLEVAEKERLDRRAKTGLDKVE